MSVMTYRNLKYRTDQLAILICIKHKGTSTYNIHYLEGYRVCCEGVVVAALWSFVFVTLGTSRKAPFIGEE